MQCAQQTGKLLTGKTHTYKEMNVFEICFYNCIVGSEPMLN
jgi:hypothetical protein